MTIELDSAKINALRRTGLLKTIVPSAYRDRIDAIELKRSVSFKTEHYLLKDSVDKLDDTVTLTINDAIIDRLDYQPVKAKVYYSGNSTVALIFDRRKPKNPFGLPASETQPTADDSPRLFARLDNQRGISGWMTGLAKIQLKTSFGNLSIDSNKIAGIRFNTNSSGRVAVRLKSGDTLSGYPNFDSISMKCSWGKQKILLSELKSVTTNRRSRFAEDPFHKGRWRFESDFNNTPNLPVEYQPLSKITSNSNLN
jgi:hypothetical protein